MSRYCYLVFVVILLVKTSETGVPEKIPLTVYYESLCPDSKDFIVKQLKPALQLLHPYFKLNLIAFGKAHSIDKKYFQCQHGPSECTGNMVQSCALQLMDESGSSDLQKLNYVVCEMTSKAGARGNLECVKRARLNEDLISLCLSNGIGTQLLLHNEYLTNLVKPRFIPTVTIVDTFNQQIQDSALLDLTGTLCSWFKDIPPCARLYNDRAMKQLL